MKSVDVLIAGQGAAAYASALYAARYRLNTVVAGEQFGGETAIGGLIENYPGTPDIDGFDLMLKFKEQVDALDVPLASSDIADVEHVSDGFRCRLEDGEEYKATAVVLAIGRERRKLGLPHEEDWIGKGVSYCSTCDAPLYRNKAAVAVVGGGNAAVEGAILIAKYVKTVYLVYRGERFFRPEPILLQSLAKAENVKALFKTEIAELLGDDEKGLTGVRLTRSHEGADVLMLDGLFVEAGADPRNDIPKKLGMRLDERTGEVVVDKAQHTNVEGIFAAGDLTNGSDLKQTITAASQGAIAALSAYQHVMRSRVAGTPATA